MRRSCGRAIPTARSSPISRFRSITHSASTSKALMMSNSWSIWPLCSSANSVSSLSDTTGYAASISSRALRTAAASASSATVTYAKLSSGGVLAAS